MCSTMSTSANGMSLCTDSTAAASSSNQYNMYRYMYNSPRRPEGVHQLLWHKVEMLLVYTWVLIQTLFLIAGLAVLHFSTFSVMMCYLINGVVKGRREFLPQK